MLNEDALYHTMDYGLYSHRFCIAGEHMSIDVYDEESMELVQSLYSDDGPAHSSKILSCRFFPDGSEKLYSACKSGQVKIWDLHTVKEVQRLTGPPISGESVDLSKDLKYLLTGM